MRCRKKQLNYFEVELGTPALDNIFVLTICFYNWPFHIKLKLGGFRHQSFWEIFIFVLTVLSIVFSLSKIHKNIKFLCTLNCRLWNGQQHDLSGSFFDVIINVSSSKMLLCTMLPLNNFVDLLHINLTWKSINEWK